MAKKPPTKRELLRVIGECQSLFGSIASTYGNDRAPDRADKLEVLYKRGFELCLKTLSHFPPGRLSGGELISYTVDGTSDG